jgi:hypothetical protein
MASLASLGCRRRVRLVEQQHLGLERDGAGDHQALLLAAGQAHAAFRTKHPAAALPPNGRKIPFEKERL